MIDRLLEIVHCPECGASDLKVDTFTTDGQEIMNGVLRCSRCPTWYPIIAGVPRLLCEPLRSTLLLPRHQSFFDTYRDRLPTATAAESEKNASSRPEQEKILLQQQTAESFAYEWSTFHRMFDSYRQNFLEYIAPLQPSFFEGKLVLDAGCGVGRHSYWAAKFGSEVVALDLGDAVEAAFQNCKGLSVHVVQADILRPPFGQIFDHVFSIGVLHHLPRPQDGFKALVPLVKRGGGVSIWVYGRRHNLWAVYGYEALRRVTRHIPRRLLHALCYVPAAIVESLNWIYSILRRIPGAARVSEYIPFRYYARFPFEVKVNDAFDVLATPSSTYWTIEQIQSWYADAHVSDPRVSLLRKKSIIAHGTIV